METNKKWTKESDSRFIFWIDNQQMGSMEIAQRTGERKATVQLGNQSLEIRKTGFWKNGFKVTDASGRTIAEAQPEKWYSRRLALTCQGKKYTLVIRNNPLVEWVVQENNKDVSAYGLDTRNGKASIRITSAPGNTDTLLDIILWYLFQPIATEHCADDYIFLLLVS